MKKLKLLIISIGIIIVLFIALGCGFLYKKATDSKLSSKNTISTNTTQKINSSLPSAKRSSVENTSSSQSKNISATITNTNNNSSEMTLANNINIGANASLGPLFESYIQKVDGINSWATKAGNESRFQTDVGIQELNMDISKNFVTLRENLDSTIKNYVSTRTSNALDAQTTAWQNYIIAENNAIANNNGSIVPVDQSSNYASINQNEVIFNIYSHMYDNGLNPTFGDNYLNRNLKLFENPTLPNGQNYTNTELNFLNNSIATINNIENKSANLTNEAMNNQISFEKAYNDIYYLWNDFLNSEYQTLMAKSVYKSQITQEEIPWVNFKEQMINTETLAYSNKTELDLAQAKMNIRLTEMQIFNLLGYFSTI